MMTTTITVNGHIKSIVGWFEAAEQEVVNRAHSVRQELRSEVVRWFHLAASWNYAKQETEEEE